MNGKDTGNNGVTQIIIVIFLCFNEQIWMTYCWEDDFKY